MPENPVKRVKRLIIGAGPTGLGAGYRLKELGESDFTIVDAAPHVGGLAKSFRDEKGFTWDIGGHVQFSHYAYFDTLMEKALGKDGWHRHERESWVWMRDRFIPYPLQNNIRHLPKEEMWGCIQGLIEVYKNPQTKPPTNFREWIQATFGKGLAEVFMEPYNFKVWAYPPETMSYEWIGERVAVTDLARVLKNILDEKDDLSWGPNNTFQFPKRGGTGAIWESVADLVGRDHIVLEKKLTGISSEKKAATFSDGTCIQFETLLSTMPLDTLLECVDGLSETIRAAGRKLKYSSSNIVGIGLEGEMPETLRKKCWMYFPESDNPFYRVTVFSNYADENVPAPGRQWSLMAEVSESSEKPVNTSMIIDDVIAGMRKTRLIDERSKIVSRWSYRAGHGYPTPFTGRNEILKTIHDGLEPKAIYSRGRFGGWKYEVSNQDHSLMQGVEWTNRIVHGVPETTYFFPSVANANWGK